MSDHDPSVDLSEFVGGFVVEADELIAAANAALLELDTAPDHAHPRGVRELFRALHTLKGLAGMIGVAPIVELAHALETVVRRADRAGGVLAESAIELALEAVRAIADRVRQIAERRAVTPAPERLLLSLAALEGGDPAAALATVPVAREWEGRLSASEQQQLATALQRGAAVWSLSFAPSQPKATAGITIASVRARLSALGDIIKVAPRTTPDGVAFDLLVVSAAPAAELADAAALQADELRRIAVPDAEPGAAAAGAPEPTSEPADALPIGRAIVRVELGRLDALQDQLSGLIVSRFQLEREIATLAASGHDVRRLHEIAALQARQLRDLRRAILRARTVRVAEVLEPLALLVRGLVKASGKQVELAIEARDTEIDKAVADRLLPAIVHLVRNAVDHAIEPTNDRIARGKPAAGALRITSTELAGSDLELIVADDGRGIDRVVVGRRAGRDLGSDAELLDVLTTPGFSTRDVATQTSGRGLGMDIVKRIVVGELGGTIALATEVGAGTRFRLRVPLTLAILDVLSFECGGQPFVAPVAMIDEIFELGRFPAIRPPRDDDGGAAVSLVPWRGRALPLVALDAVLAIGSGERARDAMVIRRGDQPVGFAIDRVLGRQEVVVRPVSDPLVRVTGIAGATDLGDGRPTIVLDLIALGHHVLGRGAGRPEVPA